MKNTPIFYHCILRFFVIISFNHSYILNGFIQVCLNSQNLCIFLRKLQLKSFKLVFFKLYANTYARKLKKLPFFSVSLHISLMPKTTGPKEQVANLASLRGSVGVDVH